MLGALKLSAPPPAADTLTRFAINVETRAQAQAIQTFLWCLWLSALHQTRSGYATEVKHATTGQSYWKVDVGGRNDDGQLKAATLGGTLTVNHGYSAADNLGRISTINVTSGANGANPLLAQTFDFESVGNLKGRSLTGGTGGTGASARAEAETFAYDTLDRLLQTSGSGITDTGSNVIDLAGNLSSKAGLLLGYAANSNRLCAIGASTCGTGTGSIAVDANGNIQSYTRPTAAQLPNNGNNTPGADGAFLQLNGYTAFNLPTSVTKTLSGAITASAEFFYDAGYQRTRQIKRSGPTQTGSFVDDILYVVPGGFEVHRNATGQIIKSIATISGSDGVVATVTTSFDAITGIPLLQAASAQNALDVSSNHSGTNTVTKLILKDHLGSMVAEITLAGTPSGPVVLINTLSIHGFGPWGNARNAAAALAEGQRGFTGHEHLGELGIIHMNGRLYDPVVGRFLQADPIIQAPHNAQSHNRYAYVMNNPLSFTDPSGFSAWSQWRGVIGAIVAAAFMQYYAVPAILGSIGSVGGVTLATTSAAGVVTLSATGSFVGAVATGFAAGGIQGGNIQSALQGAFFAGVTFGLAEGFGLHGSAIVDRTLSGGKLAGQVALHTAMGCAQSAAAGGSCRAGAIGAGVSAFASPALGNLNFAGKLVASAIIGGISARLAGGKFENGAMSAAFGYLFNEMGGCFSRGYCTKDAASNGRIGSLHPSIRDNVTGFLNAVDSELGVQLRVSQGLRTDAEQDGLYAQGRTTAGSKVTNARGGQSNHNYGLAIDVVAMNRDGSVNWGFDMSSVAPVAQRFGFSWGGNWSRFPDYPHFENTFGLSIGQMQSLRPTGTLYPIIPRAAHWNN